MSLGFGLRYRRSGKRGPGRRSGGVPNLLPFPFPFLPGVGFLLALCQEAGSTVAPVAFMGFGPLGARLLARPTAPPLVDLKIYQQGGGSVVARAGGGVP